MDADYNFLIVEDEFLIAEMIVQILKNAGHQQVRQADSVEAAIKEIEIKKPNIVLTDIALGKGKTGIELGQLLYSTYHIPFIYVSSHSSPEILNKAKHTRPNAYIVKPFKEEDLLVAIELALFNSGHENVISSEDEELTVKEGRAIVKLAYSEIVVFEAEGNYTAITMNNGRRRMVRMPISDFESQLNEKYFVRIHKSYLVNLSYVKEARSSSLIVKNQDLPIGRKYQSSVASRFQKL